MKIRVQHTDGHMETITLVPPIEVFDKVGFELTHFSCGDGTDHYFTLEGYYDGWGRGVCGIGAEQAGEIIQKVEESREHEPASPSDREEGKK